MIREPFPDRSTLALHEVRGFVDELERPNTLRFIETVINVLRVEAC